MSIINENTFQYYCTLCQDVQKIQNQIKKEDITPQLRIALHKQLEGLQDSIEIFRQNTLQTQKQMVTQFIQIEEIERQIISLYRVIEERFEEYEINLISKEAMELSQSVESGKMFQIAKQINALRHTIHFLFQHRCPSMKNRKILNLALKLSDHADTVLVSKGKEMQEQLQLIQILKNLLKEALMSAEDCGDTSQEDLAMELYEISDLFQNHRSQEGRLKLNLIRSKLTELQQKRIDASFYNSKEMVEVLSEIADGDPCLEWSAETSESTNIIHFLQG